MCRFLRRFGLQVEGWGVGCVGLVAWVQSLGIKV